MIKYFETSAKTNPQEIFQIFKSLANDILDANNDIYKVNYLLDFKYFINIMLLSLLWKKEILRKGNIEKIFISQKVVSTDLWVPL